MFPNYDTCRKDRALSEKLYLVDYRKNVFRIAGSTENLYTVHREEKWSCNCPDFQTRNVICKHILFVWLRLLKWDEKSDLPEFEESNVDDNLMLPPAMRSQMMKINEEEDCSICFESFDDCLEDGFCQEICKRRFHKNCLLEWLEKNNSCPMCRSYLTEVKDFYFLD